MGLTFNSILCDSGISLEDVRLIRHKDNRAARGYTPYDLWRDVDKRPQFELYQSTQSIKNRAKLNAKHWAVFLGTPADETLFVGLYGVKYRGLLEEDLPQPHLPDQVDKAGTCDWYDLTLEKRLAHLIGRLLIDWGPGKLAWVQYAHKKDKPIIELRKEFKEPDFPGFLNFIKPLSEIDSLPNNWISVLKSSKGIYLLTCPRTREQYVGSATGEECFWQRWQDYIRTGHGGNVKLKSRDKSDYQVSILEVAGSASTDQEILRAEQRWMRKLQSKEMGLNR
jgi:GIY-YIG catalytic domain